MKFSVLMSVYYKEKADYLEAALESIASQTLKPNELVIIADGKLTQELYHTISVFFEKYSKVISCKLLTLEKNVGLGLALKRGIYECSYDVIARMDSDDISDNNRFKEQIDFLIKHPSYDCVGCFEAEFESSISKINSIHKVPESSDQIKQFMKKRCAILHPTVIYRRKAVLKAGNYKNIKLYEDYDLFMRMVLKCGFKCYNIQKPLYFIRINDNFYKRRGGINYLKTVLHFKWSQYRLGYMSLKDFVISGGGQACVCLLPNKLRKQFYNNFLR